MQFPQRHVRAYISYADGPGAAAPLSPPPPGCAGGLSGRSSLAVRISAAADNGDRLDQPTKYEVVR